MTAADPPPRAAGRSGPRDHASWAVSYFQAWVVAGPGALPMNPPTNQIVEPTTTPLAWVNASGMFFNCVHLLAAVSYAWTWGVMGKWTPSFGRPPLRPSSMNPLTT